MTLSSTTNASFDLNGDGWEYAFVPKILASVDDLIYDEEYTFYRDAEGELFETGIEYRVYARHPIYRPNPILYRFSFSSSGVVIPIDSPTTTPTVPQTPETLDSVVGRNPITDKYSQVGSLGVKEVDDNINFEYIYVATIIGGGIFKLSKAGIAFFIDRIYNVLINKMILEGRFNGTGGGSGGGAGLSNEDIDKLAEYDYLWEVWKEERRDENDVLIQPTKPAYPVLSGGAPVTPTLPAVINSVQGKYEKESIGYTSQANVSNATEVYTQLMGRNGAVPPDSARHLMNIIGEDGSTRSFALPYFNLPSGGFLPAGDYTERISIGAVGAIYQDRLFSVTAGVVDTNNYRIVGAIEVIEGTNSTIYKVQRLRNDGTPNGTWIDFAGSKTWVLIGNPAGTGIDGNGNMQVPDNTITADVQITVRCFIGVNIELPVLLRNKTTATTPKVISATFDDVGQNVGRIALANSTAIAEVMLAVFRVINGTEQTSAAYVTGWQEAGITPGARPYSEGVTTVQSVFGYDSDKGLTDDLYVFRWIWRPKGVTSDANGEYVYHPPKQVTIGSGTTPTLSVSGVRMRTINNGTWVFYIKTSPLSNAGSSAPAIYGRAKTAQGGNRDSGYGAWDANNNLAGLNVSSIGTLFSQNEYNNGYYGLYYANSNGSGNSDGKYLIWIQLSMSPDGANAIELGPYEVDVNQNKPTPIDVYDGSGATTNWQFS